MRLSQQLFVSLALTLLVCLPATAQPAASDDATLALASTLVDEDMIRSVSQAMYDRGFLKDLNPESLEKVHDELDYEALESQVAEILGQHLSLEEIRAYLSFLQSPVGIKLRKHEKLVSESFITELIQSLTPPVEALNDRLESPVLNVSDLASELILEREIFGHLDDTTPRLLKQWLVAKGPKSSPGVWQDILDDVDFEAFVDRLEKVFESPLTPREEKVYDDFESSTVGRRIHQKRPALMADIQNAAVQWTLTSLEAIQQRIRSGELTTPSLTQKRGMRDTVRSVREVGDAMMEWIMDVIEFPTETPAPPADGEEKAWQVRQEGKEPRAFRRISHEQLTQLLVPKYLQEVPATDGWGHAFEFAVNANLLETTVLSIRSPGQDGQFDTGIYLVGPFPMDEADHDVVWTDGYFSRWPQKDTPTGGGPNR